MDPHCENHQLFCCRLSKNMKFFWILLRIDVGIDLFSRAASSQVSSAQMSLTSVFGMGTGGPSALITPTISCNLPFGKSQFTHGSLRVMHLQGFEPGTHWLRVSCSTNWAKGALYFWIADSKVHWKFLQNFSIVLRPLIQLLGFTLLCFQGIVPWKPNKTHLEVCS